MQRNLILVGILMAGAGTRIAAQAGPPPEAWDSRRYDQFTYIAAHNAFANHQQGYKQHSANQYVSIANQLNAGVTTFLMDIWLVRQHRTDDKWHVEYYTSGRGYTDKSFKDDELELVVAHGLDQSTFGGYFLLDGYPALNPRFRKLRVDLKTIVGFMKDYPKVPITLFFESYTDQADMVANELKAAGAWNRIFWADRPNVGFKAKDGTDWDVKKHGWPPLAVMGYYGKMLVVFSDSGEDGLPKDHKFICENVYGNASLHEDTVWKTRDGSDNIGDLKKSLLFMNRMPTLITDSLASVNNEKLGLWNFDKLNAYGDVWDAAEIVTQHALRLPNYLNVDWFNYGKNGGVPRVVDELNRYGWAKASPIHHVAWRLQEPNAKGWNKTPVTIYFATFGAELISRVYEVFGDPADTGVHLHGLSGNYDGSRVTFSHEGEYSVSSYGLGYGVDPWDNGNTVIGRSGTESTILRIDRTNPSLFVAGIPSFWSRFDITFSAAASDATSGVEGVYYKTRSIYTRYTAPIVFTEEGQSGLDVKAVDNAGNETVKQYQIKIDKTLPTIAHSDSERFVSLTASDALSGIWKVSYRIDPATEYSDYNAPFLVPGWGKVLVRYKAQDFAGNVSTESYYKQMPFDQTGRVTVVEKRDWDYKDGEWLARIVVINTDKVNSVEGPVWLLVAPRTGGTTLLTASQEVTEPSERSSRAVNCGGSLAPGEKRGLVLRFKGPATGISFRTKVVAGPGPL